MPASEILATLVHEFPLTLLAGMLCGAMCAYAGFFLAREEMPLVGISLSQIAVLGVAASYFQWMPSDGLHNSLLLTFVAALSFAFLKIEGERMTRTLLLVFVLSLMLRMLIMSRSTQDANFEMETVLKGYVWFVTPPTFYLVLGCALVTLLHAVVQGTALGGLREKGRNEASGSGTRARAFLFGTIALGIAVSVHSAGDIFVVGLLLLPPLTASIMAQKNVHRFVLTVLIGLLVPVGGLAAAFRYDLPPGASSVAVVTLLFLTVWILGKFRSLISKPL